MSRYVPALDSMVGHQNKGDLSKKLEALSRITELIDREDISIRDKISIITILQYLKEIIKQFNAKSAGFLFENFLAALIYGDVIDDHGTIDIINKFHENYQIKLYKNVGTIEVNIKTLCDFYVIGLKGNDGVSIHILNGKNPDDELYIGKFLTDGKKVKTMGDDKINISISKLNKKKNVRVINIDKVNEWIEKCSDSVYESIENVYDQLSQLQYDIDSIVIGRDRNKTPIDIDSATKNANNTISKIEQEVSNLNKGLR
jgi:hypothetical protein